MRRQNINAQAAHRMHHTFARAHDQPRLYNHLHNLQSQSCAKASARTHRTSLKQWPSTSSPRSRRRSTLAVSARVGMRLLINRGSARACGARDRSAVLRAGQERGTTIPESGARALLPHTRQSSAPPPSAALSTWMHFSRQYAQLADDQPLPTTHTTKQLRIRWRTTLPPRASPATRSSSR